VSWREQAIARSLDSARTRAEGRVQRFLDAALELIQNGGGEEFTVQEVVERSGQSLRSFYQYFGGKHELLLALFEESVRAAAEHLRAKVADEADPVERLHRIVVEYFVICRPALDRTSAEEREFPVMVDFAQQLLTSHPEEAARAFLPVVTLVERALDEAAAAGAIRPELRGRRIAGVVLGAVMFNLFSSRIAGSPDEPGSVESAEELWNLLLDGMGNAPRDVAG
jgi:AcrR family transcriptional regulator